MDEGKTEAIARVSVGFQGLKADDWAPGATIYLPGDGDTLATEMIQGNATARHAYENFEPDGRYLELTDVSFQKTSPAKSLREKMNEMDGPDIAAVRKTVPEIQYRINLEGTWYDATTSTRAYVAKVDGRWYTSTGVTPWYLVTDLIPDASKMPPHEIAQINRDVTLPLGPTSTTTSGGG